MAVAAALILMMRGATAMGARSPQPEGRTSTSAAGITATRQSQILILAADDFTRPWVQLTVEGFRDVVLKHPNPPVLSFETLDAPRFDGPEYAEKLRAWWSYKYRDRPFDLIVALGEDTVRFLAEHDGDPWPQTPVLFAEVGGVRVDTARHLPHAEGMIFEEHFQAALRVVKSILPATTHVALIRGASLTETDRWDSFDESVRTAGLGLAPIVLAGLSMEDLLFKVAHLPEHTVIYILAPTIDAQGRVLPQDLACELISSAANQPAFSMQTHDLGCGIVGGLLRDFSRVGRLVGEQALHRLQTHTSQSTRVASARYTTLAFDARQLARWGIDETRLPAGSTVQYREPSYWREHRTLIIVAASVAGLQALLIAGLLFEHQRRRRAEVTSRQHLAMMAHLDRRVAMGELTTSLAHELNQPLNAILQNAGAAEMMLATMGSDRGLDEVKEILADIRKDDVRAGQTIHRMRSLLSKRELQTESLDLNDVARDTIALVSADAQDADPPSLHHAVEVAGPGEADKVLAEFGSWRCVGRLGRRFLRGRLGRRLLRGRLGLPGRSRGEDDEQQQHREAGFTHPAGCAGNRERAF